MGREGPVVHAEPHLVRPMHDRSIAHEISLSLEIVGVPPQKIVCPQTLKEEQRIGRVERLRKYDGIGRWNGSVALVWKIGGSGLISRVVQAKVACGRR